MSERLNYLLQKKNQLKKERNRRFRKLYFSCITPLKVWGIGFLIQIFIFFVFKWGWGIKVYSGEDVVDWFQWLILLSVVSFFWGIYLIYKLKKILRKLDKIDKEIEEELNGSDF